jgi:hypothetical protein
VTKLNFKTGFFFLRWGRGWLFIKMSLEMVYWLLPGVDVVEEWGEQNTLSQEGTQTKLNFKGKYDE